MLLLYLFSGEKIHPKPQLWTITWPLMNESEKHHHINVIPSTPPSDNTERVRRRKAEFKRDTKGKSEGDRLLVETYLCRQSQLSILQ